jgi:hypothetical protein
MMQITQMVRNVPLHTSTETTLLQVIFSEVLFHLTIFQLKLVWMSLMPDLSVLFTTKVPEMTKAVLHCMTLTSVSTWGTGGAARFTTRFHSLDFHVVTANGQRMDVAGMADTGNVGTICSNPREGRTVMGFGCKLDSAYEIWENKLNIVNKGNSVAMAITSTAVFDPITVMNPSDLTKAIPVWDPQADSQIFKFNDSRDGYRGCERESYTGPLMWFNANGAQVTTQMFMEMS